MTNKRKISITGIISAALMFFVFISMFMPLVGYSSRYWGSYTYSFFDLLDLALNNLDEFWALLHTLIFVLFLGALVFAILSIFKRKMGIASAIFSAFAFNILLLYALVEEIDLDYIGTGAVLMVLLFLANFVISIITAARGSSDSQSKLYPSYASYPSASPSPYSYTTPDLVCRHCHRTLSPGSKFCSFCAAPVEDEPQRFCPSCGTAVPAGHSFCAKCGNNVNGTPAAEKPSNTTWSHGGDL